MNQALIVKLYSHRFSIKMDNCGDLNSFQIKLEQTELIIKDEPEEVAIENSSLDDEYDTSLPTLDIKNLLNTQMNDFDALEVKLEQDELIIKDEPEEVIENTSSLEIIKFDTNPVTLGIRDRIANSQIKVDPSICRIEDLLSICTCAVEVIVIPQHVFATKMEQYLGSKLQNVAEVNYDDEDCTSQEDAIKCKHKITKLVGGDRRKVFGENIDLKVHKLSHKNKKRFKCKHCKISFTLNGTFKIHMLTHEADKSFKCQQCNKCFTENSNLKRHMLIHKGLKPFKCQHCSKCFTENSSLKRHTLTHKGLKPFKCQQCNKCFTENGNLKKHMWIHKGCKPFKCQQCNKCFAVNGDLKRHILIHKGHKPFKCQECNKCFTYRSNLERHILVHKGLKPFKCQQCNRCFTESSNRNRHMLIHRELKPFKCQRCNKSFTVNYYLKRHMLIHK